MPRPNPQPQHPAAQAGPVLRAPQQWTCVDFISDLHLQAGEPDTFTAWRSYMDRSPADAVFILGDWFEVWVGDDAVATDTSTEHEGLGFERRCERVMRYASERAALYLMHGNRDFLLGRQFAAACQAQLLADPTVLEFAGQRVLLSHGDALCLSDLEYQDFRAQVRSAAWQQGFLAKPVGERRSIARGLRDASEARKASGAAYADVDSAAAVELLRRCGCSTLIHGHTHAPRTHDLGEGLQRLVLSDWDARANPPRAQVLRWRAEAPTRFERVNLLA
jgi:UDP-2,3-diacylglucosamine hydrolase